ncbi:MAG: hypothetical protein KKA42_08860 [candidate division Zixibacteria bacterium]|nr:hypothetical protein [candidate division Zixibacteria bacterium]
MGKIKKSWRKFKKLIKAPTALKIESMPAQFAPSAENCEVAYFWKKQVKKPGDIPRAVVTDKDGTEILDVPMLGQLGSLDGKDTWKWNGKDKDGAWVSPLKSPFTVTIKSPTYQKIKTSKKVNVTIRGVALEIDAPDSRLIMNTPPPDGTIAVAGVVLLKKADGSGVATRIPLDVAFEVLAAPRGNASKTDSFKYQASKYLGSRGDADHIHWELPADSHGDSDDSLKKKCLVRTRVEDTPDRGKAKVFFKPSGVGGDQHEIQATVFSADGKSKLATEKSGKLTVWRKIDFDKIYTMRGETFIDNATKHSEIAPAYETKGYVLYTRGTVTTLNANLTVKYIGLYKSSGTHQWDWPTDYSPQKLEDSAYDLRPTAAELADYAGADAAKKAAAKTKIEAKAQKWFSAVVSAYLVSVTNWFAAAGINEMENSLLGVQYYHPKLSGQGDGATNFWPANISINLANPGSGLNKPGHPDRATWRIVAGFSRNNLAVVFKNYPDDDDLQNTCRHEIGHATKSAFKRASFGTGDHSGSGLMRYDGGGVNVFSNADIKKLRGFK